MPVNKFCLSATAISRNKTNTLLVRWLPRWENETIYTKQKRNRLFASCQFHQVACNNNKSVKIRLVQTCHLQTLKQLAARLWITIFDNQLVTRLDNLQQTCLVQDIASHPNAS